jgi:uncharacterized protein
MESMPLSSRHNKKNAVPVFGSGREDHTMPRVEHIVRRLMAMILKQPLLISTAIVLICSLTFFGLKDFGLNPSPRDYLGKDMPLVKHLIALEQEYVEEINILLVLIPKDGTVFSPQTLAAVEQLTNEAWFLPFAKRVDSISNFQYTWAEGDELNVEDLVSNASTLTDNDIQKIRQIALHEPRLVNSLVADDGGATAVNILFDVDPGKTDDIKAVYDALIPIKDSLEEKYPNLELYESGFLSLAEHWRRAAFIDVKTIFSLSLIAIMAGLAYFFGNIRATLAVIAIAALPSIIGLGLLGILGIVLNPASILSTLMILVLGLADGIHITKSVRRLLADGMEYREAIAQAVVSNFTPIALTSVTTAIGFLTFNVSGYSGVALMGNFVAFGVMLAYLLSVTLLPALLCFCNLKPEKKSSGTSRHIQFANFVIARHKFFLLLTGPAAIICIFCIHLLEIDDRITRYLKEDYVFTRHMNTIQEELTGTTSIIYNFNSGESGGVSDPAFLRKVEAFTQWVKKDPNVRHVSSYTDTLKNLNQNLNGGDDRFYTLPENNDLAAQYLLLYEMSLPYGLDLTNLVNLDKSGTRVLITTNDMSIQTAQALVDKNRQWLEKNAPGFDPVANSNTLSGMMMAADSIIILAGSGITALIIIGLILLFTFRSFNAGLLCVISVISPILVTYGVWGITVGTMSLPAAMAICMVIGTAVDFSVHFISKFVVARRQKGASKEDSIRYAFNLVSAPILTSVVVLGGGFLILVLSTFQYNYVMGAITSLCIFFSALATFLLIPSLLMTGKFTIK